MSWYNIFRRHSYLQCAHLKITNIVWYLPTQIVVAQVPDKIPRTQDFVKYFTISGCLKQLEWNKEQTIESRKI